MSTLLGCRKNLSTYVEIEEVRHEKLDQRDHRYIVRLELLFEDYTFVLSSCCVKFR